MKQAGYMMLSSRYAILLAVVSITALISGPGCGYQFSAGGEPVGININSLAIPLVTSTSSDRGFEADFTTAVREEFISHANIPLVSEENADKVLSGRIYEITTKPLTYNSAERTVGGRAVNYESTSSRRLKIRLDIMLTDRATGRVIWHESSMEEETRFNVSADPLATRYNRRQALIRISRLLAERIYMKTMEGF